MLPELPCTNWLNPEKEQEKWLSCFSKVKGKHYFTSGTPIKLQVYLWWLVADLRRAILLASIRAGDVSESIEWGCFIRSSYIFMANTLADDWPIIPSEFIAFMEPPRGGWFGSLRCSWAVRCCMNCNCCICSCCCCCCSLAFICCA